MNVNERDEISASVAAHAELGPRYESAVAEGLVERIGEEIDRRIDSRLGGRSAAPQRSAPLPPPPGYSGPSGPLPEQAAAAPPARHGNGLSGLSGMVLGIASLGLGVGATSVVVSHHAAAVAQVLMVLLIWAAITVINVAHARRKI